MEGNNYNLNIKNFLFKNGSVVISDDLELEKRKFFCSELIVKAYKELGLMNTTKTSQSFSPHDLSALAKSPIKLVGDRTLDKDHVIIFDRSDRMTWKKNTGKK